MMSWPEVTPMCKESLTKLEAAKRQMNEAIRLLFDRRDIVAIHTLTSAAGQILSDLCAAEGTPSIVRGAAFIKKERRREWLNAVKAAENFFKHADHDPDGVFELRIGMTEGMLWDTTHAYYLLTGRQTYEGFIFQTWFYLKHPEMLLESDYKRMLLESADRLSLQPEEMDLFADALKLKRFLPSNISMMLD